MHSTDNLHKYTFWSIVVLGVALRIIGVQFGLPNLYHADEPIVVNHAVAYASGDFNPHFFKIPPLISYLLFLAYGSYFVLGRAVGVFGSVSDFESLFLLDPSSFYLIGRILFGVLPAVATIIALYHFSKRFYGRDHALVTSFLMATVYLHVRDSHFLYVDIPLLLVIVVALDRIFRIMNDKRPSDLCIFGVLLGLATATKYNGFFILPAFLAGYCIRFGVTDLFRNKSVYAAALISAVTFFILNPFGLLDFSQFVGELRSQAGSEGSVGLLHHLKYSLLGGLGLPLLVVSLCGLALGLIQKSHRAIVLAVYVVVYYAVLCLFSQPFDRYVLPLVPVLIVFAADFLIFLGARLNRWQFALPLLVVVIQAPSLLSSYRCDQLLLRPDTRTLAQQWVEANVGGGRSIGLDAKFYMPNLKPSLIQLTSKLSEVQEGIGASRAQKKRLELLVQQASSTDEPRFNLYFLTDNPKAEHFLFNKPAISKDIATIKQAELDYVIIAKQDAARNSNFFHALKDSATLVKRFSPYSEDKIEWALDQQPLTGAPFSWRELIARERNGHILEIYKIA
jgi:hypothetical protein